MLLIAFLTLLALFVTAPVSAGPGASEYSPVPAETCTVCHGGHEVTLVNGEKAGGVSAAAPDPTDTISLTATGDTDPLDCPSISTVHAAWQLIGDETITLNGQLLGRAMPPPDCDVFVRPYVTRGG